MSETIESANQIAPKEPSAPQSTAQSASQTVFPILFAISCAHFLNDMMQSVIPSIYPLIKSEFALTFAQIGIITFVFQLTSSILQPFVGYFNDRFPKPYTLAVGMAFTFFGLCLLAFANHFYLLLLAVSIIGWGSSVFHPSASKVTQVASGGRKGLAQSIFQVGGNSGSAVGPLFAAIIIIPRGQYAVSYFAIAAVVAFIILCRIGAWYSGKISELKSNKRVSTADISHLSKGRIQFAIFILVALTFSKYFYIASMTNYYTFFLMDKFHISVQESQLCLFAFLGALAVGTVVGGGLGDRFGRKYVIWASILGAAPFTIALPYSPLFVTIILSIIIGFVIASAFSAILVYATDLMPTRVGMVAGMFFGLSFGLGGVGSAFFGWLADKTSIEFVFQVSTLLPLLGVITGLLPNIEGNHKKPAKA